MIDIYKVIEDLREQQSWVERAIVAFEEMARLREPRRGRPPKSLSSPSKTSRRVIDQGVQTQSAKT
jgi:hypothetical protein